MLELANLVVFAILFGIWSKNGLFNISLKLLLLAMTISNAFATYHIFYH